jgi:hypothetical protein
MTVDRHLHHQRQGRREKLGSLNQREGSKHIAFDMVTYPDHARSTYQFTASQTGLLHARLNTDATASDP